VNDLNTLRVGGRRVLEPLFEQSALPANSDYFPLLDQRAPRARFRKDNVFQLRAMREALEPTLAMLDGDYRTTRSRLQAPGKTQPPRVARAAAGLEAVGVFAGAEAPGAPQLSVGNRINAVAARALLAGCPGAQRELLQAVTEIVASSSPYLAADEIDVVFDRVRLSPCWNDLDDIGKRRIALLRAISRRDAQGMADHSAFLLRYAKAPSEQEYSHYLASGLTALMALQQYELARNVAGRFAPGLSERERQRLLVRLVEANVKARAVDGGTR
jgi:spermidine synthase